MKRIMIVLIGIIVVMCFGNTTVLAQSPKISPLLLQEMSTRNGDEFISILICMSERLLNLFPRSAWPNAGFDAPRHIYNHTQVHSRY